MGGTSDLREPCPHVKPLIRHHTRHPAPHKTYGHHAGTNVNLAGAVAGYGFLRYSSTLDVITLCGRHRMACCT